MLRYRLNEIELVVDIVPRGPLLIAEGEQESPPGASLPEGEAFDKGVEKALKLLEDRPEAEKEEVGGVDAFFVKTYRNGGEEPFIPGSSLKGILRQRAEQLTRTMDGRCCNLFAKAADVTDEGEVSCSVQIEQRRRADDNADLGGPEIYHQACLVCKLFGCLGLASRLRITDGYLVNGSYKVDRRHGVGIDRYSGGAHEGAKFQLEVLERGRFRTRLYVRNFELWQLGLLAYLLDDLAEARIRLGHGTHRGLGKIAGEIQEVRVTYFGSRDSEEQPNQLKLVGVGSLATDMGLPDAGSYGFASEDAVLLEGVSGERDGLRYQWQLPPAQQDQLWAGVALRWQDFVSTSTTEEAEV